MAIRVVVAGASGYAGIELVRLVVRHPELDLVAVTAESSAGSSLRGFGAGLPDMQILPTAAAPLDQADLIFLCLPHGASATTAARAIAAGVRVVDLSSDLRLDDPEAAARLLGHAHPAPELLPAPYGLPELGRADVTSVPAVANPGCYATAILLALAPVAKHLVPGTPIVVDAKSGASGAGRSAQVRMLFCEVAENLVPYKIGRSHHHVAEVEQELARRGVEPGGLVFAPHVVPAVRGLIANAYLQVDDAVAAAAAVRAAYAGEPLVEVLPAGELPTFAHVTRTPRAVLGTVVVGPQTLVVVSAIDNLLKGAASQAIQNANRMFGRPETMGLL